MSLLDDIISTKIVSGLLDRRRPLVDANPLQGFYDSAPAGSVMAPGGLLANPMSTPIGSTPGATQDMLGLLSFAPIVGDAAGLAADAQMYANQPETRTLGNYALSALGALPFVPSVAGATVFHGSPHQFDAFDLSKIGTGEGAQAYGHGLYFAENPEVAGEYRSFLGTSFDVDGKPVYANNKIIGSTGDAEVDDFLVANLGDVDKSIKYVEDALETTGDEVYTPILQKLQDLKARNAVSVRNTGHLYNVDLPDEQIANMLDWDAPLSEQPESVRRAVADLTNEAQAKWQGVRNGLVEKFKAAGKEFPYSKETQPVNGKTLYKYLVEDKGFGPEAASEYLNSIGIPGIKYFDGGSRAAGEGTRNYVVFDDQLPKILRRE